MIEAHALLIDVHHQITSVRHWANLTWIQTRLKILVFVFSKAQPFGLASPTLYAPPAAYQNNPKQILENRKDNHNPENSEKQQ